MPNILVIDERKITVSSDRNQGITIQDKVTNVEIGNKEIQVVSIGQRGLQGIQGVQGADGAAGSGINAEQIQSIPVSNTVPNENEVLVSHAGSWVAEPLNGGYF